MKVIIYLAMIFCIFPIVATAVEEQESNRVIHEKHLGTYISGADINLVAVAFKYYLNLNKFDYREYNNVLNFFKFKVIDKGSYYLIVIVRDLDISKASDSSDMYGSGGEFKLRKENLEIFEHSIYK
jgi:hypothetical protein